MYLNAMASKCKNVIQQKGCISSDSHFVAEDMRILCVI